MTGNHSISQKKELSFRLLGFQVNLSRSMTPPFRHSTVLSFRLLGSPLFFSAFSLKNTAAKVICLKANLGCAGFFTNVMEIETKQTFIQLVFLKAGMGTL